MREACISGTIVNRQIINVFRKKDRDSELKRAKKKSGGFAVNGLADKWRDQIYDVETF